MKHNLFILACGPFCSPTALHFFVFCPWFYSYLCLVYCYIGVCSNVILIGNSLLIRCILNIQQDFLFSRISLSLFFREGRNCHYYSWWFCLAFLCSFFFQVCHVILPGIIHTFYSKRERERKKTYVASIKK